MKQKELYIRDRPKISIIMSVFNDIVFLRQAIDSILDQTFTDFEFIIIDDGSTEDIWPILNSYKDERIVTYKNKKNLGLPGALNIGLEMAKGDFIARMDSDDISQRRRLELLLAGFTDDIGFVGCYSASITADMQRKESKWHDETMHIPKEKIKELMPTINCLASAPAMYSRKVFEKIGYYDESMRSAEDYNYFLRIIKFFDFNIINKTLYFARFNSSSYRRTPEFRKIDWGKLARERAEKIPIIMSRGIDVTSAEEWWKHQCNKWKEQVDKEKDIPALPAQKSPKDLINVAFNVIVPSKIKKEQPSILEVGCGFARTLFHLRNLLGYENVYGLDQSENMLAMAGKKFLSDYSVKEKLFFGNLRSLAPWFPKFDIIYTCVVLVHIHPEHILNCLENIAYHANDLVVHIEHMPVEKTSYYSETHEGCWRHPYIKLYEQLGLKCEVFLQRRGKHAIYTVDTRSQGVVKNQDGYYV